MNSSLTTSWPSRRAPGGLGRRAARTLACLLFGFLLALAALLGLPSLLQAQDEKASDEKMNWQEAVAELAAERTRAETCARVLKRMTAEDPAEFSRGELLYGEAKAEVDAVIAGLIVVVGHGDEAPSFESLEDRLTRGDKARKAFCGRAKALVEGKGSKNPLIALAGSFVEPLIGALVELYTFHKEGARREEELLRKTIQTQLEATKWPDFPEIKV